MIVLAGVMALLVWRGRGRLPEVLRELSPLLAEDEPVLGDGIGLVRGARGWDAAFRLVIATDRRLLVTASARAERFLIVDAPYERVSRFGFEWKHWGRAAELSLTVDGVDGAPPETHVISSVAPANLVSIASALQSHGVQADDPAALAEAAREWDEALSATRDAQRRGALKERVLDRDAMDTPEFDRGLWLVLGLGVLAFYMNPFGIGLGAARNGDALLVLLPIVGGVCGYVAGTRSSFAYLVPLNLLAAPAFFFWPAGFVFVLMVLLSGAAALGLWGGSALRKARATRAPAPAVPAAAAEGRPAPGSLRYTLGGLGLVRLTGMILAGLVTLVVTASAAGFELTSVRLAVDELTMKQLPVDGRSDLTGNSASVRYTPGPDLHEFNTDNLAEGSETDGARWELRSSFTKGFNVLSLAHYIHEPRLDNPAAVADFVARKDREHAGLAGYKVTHTEFTVDGRKGYVWNHDSRHGYWYYAAWFPQPVHTVRVECIAGRQERKFRRLCGEAIESLDFRPVP
jgi:hypothetical protein